MYCTPDTEFPQASVAVKVLVTVDGQVVDPVSLEVMVTAVQVSLASATPVTSVVMGDPQTTSMSAGMVSTGLVVSTAVMLTTDLAVTPHPSVAVKVLVKDCPEQEETAASSKTNLVFEQESEAVAVGRAGLTVPHS